MTIETVAVWLVRGLGVYLLFGLIFAVPFVRRGVERIDPAARGASAGFRWIVLPGVVALWPLLLVRWLRGAPAPVENNAHRSAARGGGGA